MSETKAQHTPGPWKAVSEAACKEIEVMEIAEVSHMRVIPAGGGWPIAGTPEADARLIAAAPELLEALKDAIDAVRVFHGPVEWETYRDHSPEMKRWQAAIAKATGSAA